MSYLWDTLTLQWNQCCSPICSIHTKISVERDNYPLLGPNIQLLFHLIHNLLILVTMHFMQNNKWLRTLSSIKTCLIPFYTCVHQKIQYLQKGPGVILVRREVFLQVVGSVSRCEALLNFLNFLTLPQLWWNLNQGICSGKISVSFIILWQDYFSLFHNFHWNV